MTYGRISYEERVDGSLTVWITRGNESCGFANGHAYTSIAVGTIPKEGVLDIADAKRVIDRTNALARYAYADAHCPCCDDEAECLDECTFAIDAPEINARMILAREALYGEQNGAGDEQQHR